MLDHIREQLNKPHSSCCMTQQWIMVRQGWAKLTCNMPILAWRWDINKLLRKKTRISCRKMLEYLYSVCLLHTLCDKCLLNHLAQGIMICNSVGWCWSDMLWSLVRGTNQRERHIFHYFLCIFTLWYASVWNNQNFKIRKQFNEDNTFLFLQLQ